MGLPLIVFPDITRAVAEQSQAWFAKHLNIDMPIGGQLPRPIPADCARLWVSGGGERRDLVIATSMLTVETYGPTEERAAELAGYFGAWIHGLEGRELIEGHPIYQVQQAAVPASLPDPTTNKPRYTATYSLDLRGKRL